VFIPNCNLPDLVIAADRLARRLNSAMGPISHQTELAEATAW